MRLLYVFAALLLLGLSACDKGMNKFTVVGEIAGLPDHDIFLEEMGISGIIVIDSTRPDANGKFEMKGTSPEPALYRLRFAENRYILLSADEGTIKVNADWSTIENYDVTGSAPSESLKKMLLVMRGHMSDLNELQVTIDTLRAKGDTTKLKAAISSARELNIGLTRYLEQYADTTKYLPNAIFAAQILNPEIEKPFLEAFVQSLPSRFPGYKMAADFTAKYNEIVSSMNKAQQQSAGVAEGTAPEISLQTPEGKTITLSSFRGKYVLVDFWASWCGPCRRENPNVVAAYNQFKDKNFTILGVSLDEDREKWKEAIAKDKLTWTHISDLQGWQSIAARDYNINAIPANFLIDPEGKIIAKDLRGDDLAATLSTLLK